MTLHPTSPHAPHRRVTRTSRIICPPRLRWAAALAAAWAAPGWAASDLCHSGRAQSPAALEASAIDAPSLPALQAQYHAQALVLANDGHTLRVRLRGAGQLRLGDARYRIEQFHFHTPGGETVRGEAFPFSAHVLHKDARGGLLAVTVPFRLGAPSPLLETLLAHVPAARSGDRAVPGVQVDARDVLPAQRGYYRYTGSLTDTPCTEGVSWLVMKQPLSLSAEQLARWKQHFADNMRAAQPLNARRVAQSAD